MLYYGLFRKLLKVRLCLTVFLYKRDNVSGKVSDEMYETISKLIVERQNKGTKAETVVKQEIPQSNADELKKYKDLLDSGVITQDEFDHKKKQLLGL